MKHLLVASLLIVLGPSLSASLIPPLKVDILDAQERKQGRALIYPNFIELTDLSGNLRGAIGVVMAQGRVQLFLVRSDQERRLIGWYRALIESVLSSLDHENHPVALEIAALPVNIRGYETVKERMISESESEAARLVEIFNGGEATRQAV